MTFADLPAVNACLNGLSAVFLLAGYRYIRQKNQPAHERCMTAAVVTSTLFLICYITYHISNPANKFYGEGSIRYVYFFFLISHILLSIVVLPFVLRALFYAVTRQFGRHKRIVKYAYPIWLYVSVSGVIVYLLLYQLFPSK